MRLFGEGKNFNPLTPNDHYSGRTAPLTSKVKVKQSRYRPGVAQRVQEVKVPRVRDKGTGWW